MDDRYRDDRSTSTLRRSSDGSAAMMEEEKEHLLESASSSPSTPTKTKRFFGGVFSVSSVIVLLALSNALLISTFAGLILRHQSNKPATSPKPADPSWMPPESYRTEIWRFQTIYGEEPSNAVEEAWTALIPKGKGFVAVNETNLPDLPRLDKSKPSQIAMVTTFHQLHCLYMTRAGYFAAKSGNLDEVNIPHLMHCWDYLRQGIMCSADTTLEWLEGEDESGSTGWGYQHTCKDFGAIYAWTEANRATDTKKIHS
ncbi:hypothetical protein QBC46DRAFT_397396 [Diplogelasinospora grovesii]|uniref:Oxidase ustYa n=1 Tax=Diplogelasinospora grovesii TaxID=303347 RepID=A0AAN6S029_9PEZI|nr:hypothetical protein QBC46DRAFT_397396 [Diplogelasinospora grovesii]